MSFAAHTSHALQPLDVAVFNYMKNAFRSCVSKRIVTRDNAVKNNVHKLRELVFFSFLESMTPSNIIARFNRSGLWCNES